MSPSDRTLQAGRVQLLDVTAGVLEELLDAALADAAPDDVTPPLGETDGWNAERIGWFRDYHRAAAAGLDGPAAASVAGASAGRPSCLSGPWHYAQERPCCGRNNRRKCGRPGTAALSGGRTGRRRCEFTGIGADQPSLTPAGGDTSGDDIAGVARLTATAVAPRPEPERERFQYWRLQGFHPTL